MSESLSSESFLCFIGLFLCCPVRIPPVDDWDDHVHSQAFNPECSVQSMRHSSSSGSNDSSERIRLLQDDSSSSMTSFESSHELPELEKFLYYFGLRGIRHYGPKLIFRTSTDVFTPPTGPEHDARMMQLLGVYDHSKLGEDNRWATIREEVCVRA